MPGAQQRRPVLFLLERLLQGSKLMALFEWDSIYSVGDEFIDNQHKRLFQIANRFYNAYQARQARTVLGSIFDELIDYTILHFKDEEELLRQHNFPEFHQHKRNHEKLIGLVSRYKEQFEQGDEGIETRVLDFLKLWLNGHIMGMDRQYKPYIAESSIRTNVRPMQGAQRQTGTQSVRSKQTNRDR